MFCLLLSEFYSIGDKIAADNFKDEITPSLKKNDRNKLTKYVVMNREIDKGQPRCKISYKVFKGEDWYDPFPDIYPFTILIQLKEFISGIHHCVTVVGNWVFDRDCIFALPLTQYELDYCCINYN